VSGFASYTFESNLLYPAQSIDSIYLPFSFGSSVGTGLRIKNVDTLGLQFRGFNFQVPYPGSFLINMMHTFIWQGAIGNTFSFTTQWIKNTTLLNPGENQSFIVDNTTGNSDVVPSNTIVTLKPGDFLTLVVEVLVSDVATGLISYLGNMMMTPI